MLAVTDLRKRGVKDLPFSAVGFFDLRNGTRSAFDDFAAVSTGRGILPRKDGTPEQVHFAGVTPNFFRLLGGKIAYGRDFTEADGQPQPPEPRAGTLPTDQVPQRLPDIAILSYEYFERRCGGDMSIIGHPIQTAGGGGPLIVGVLRPHFELLFPPQMNVETAPDIWVADRLAYDNAQRLTFGFVAVGKLKPSCDAAAGADRLLTLSRPKREDSTRSPRPPTTASASNRWAATSLRRSGPPFWRSWVPSFFFC